MLRKLFSSSASTILIMSASKNASTFFFKKKIRPSHSVKAWDKRYIHVSTTALVEDSGGNGAQLSFMFFFFATRLCMTLS